MLHQSSMAQVLADLTAGDCVVPLPLSAERLRFRGYNQSWLIARALVSQSASAAPADAALLLRIRHTAPQLNLSLAARQRNVAGAFAVDPLHAGRVRQRHVVLVDDVMTSGASLKAAAVVLREAGAHRVTALVFARTET